MAHLNVRLRQINCYIYVSNNDQSLIEAFSRNITIYKGMYFSRQLPILNRKRGTSVVYTLKLKLILRFLEGGSNL